VRQQAQRRQDIGGRLSPIGEHQDVAQPLHLRPRRYAPVRETPT
jgi:hypothetical protein